MTTGVDRPPYGTRQRKFSPFSFHELMSPVSREMPSRFGPLSSGQSPTRTRRGACWAGSVTLKGLARVVFESPQVLEGSQAAPHPAVLGDHLLTYLNQLVTMFNAHVHPGELAIGVLPVTPAPPVPPFPPATPSLLSIKVKLE